MSSGVVIRAFEPGDEAAFHDINVEWISAFFVLEAKDRETLENPRASIIDKGGAILIALVDGAAMGTAALIPMKDGGVELAKMGVRPEAQGRGLGRKIITAAIELARERGAQRVYLETNSRLGSALKLYRDAGFVDVVGEPSPYARADVQMELVLG